MNPAPPPDDVLSAEWSLSNTPGAIAESRQLVAATLESWDLDDLIDDSRLLISELVTNAIIHTGSLSAMGLRYEPSVLRLWVGDHDPQTVTMRPPTESGGWGIRLLAALSLRWGEIHFAGDGKEVWCDLDLIRPQPAPIR